jgi:hypothetical protein
MRSLQGTYQDVIVFAVSGLRTLFLPACKGGQSMFIGYEPDE